MSKGAPSDDFFGIEYISSNSLQESERIQKITQNEPRSSTENGPKQLEGSKFIDDQFFPEIMKRVKGEEAIGTSDRPELAERLADEFYEQYGMKLQKLNENYRREGRLPFNEATPERGDQFSSVQNKMRAHDNFFEEIRQKREEESRKKSKPKRQQPKREATVSQEDSTSGLQILRSSIAPVWSFNDEDLVNYLAQRIILSTPNLVAFDKPYGLPYSGAADNIPQFDRVLQKVKAIVAPKCERLHLARSLDKDQSGVMLFATSKLALSEAKEMMKDAIFTHRCLVRGVLDGEIEVTIPLVRKLTGKDLTMQPALSNKVKGEISHGTTKFSSIRTIEGITYIEAETTNEATHQLRCHLGLAKIPLIGDAKYGNNNGIVPKLPHHLLSSLNLSINQGKKVGPYSHLLNMSLPFPDGVQPRTVIHAPLPEHFKWLLRKLKFIKK